MLAQLPYTASTCTEISSAAVIGNPNFPLNGALLLVDYPYPKLQSIVTCHNTDSWGSGGCQHLTHGYVATFVGGQVVASSGGGSHPLECYPTTLADNEEIVEVIGHTSTCNSGIPHGVTFVIKDFNGNTRTSLHGWSTGGY